MKEDVYQKYSPDEDVVARDKGMEDAMPTAEYVFERFQRNKERFANAPVGKLNLDLRALKAARRIWQLMRNPYIATNDASHPNNWTEHQLLTMAGAIQAELGIPTLENTGG